MPEGDFFECLRVLRMVMAFAPFHEAWDEELRVAEDYLCRYDPNYERELT